MRKVIDRIGNIVSNILLVILIFLIIIASYVFVQMKLLHREYVSFFGYTYFNIISGSMVDTINIDDFVFVKQTSDVKKDDIITFYMDHDLVTHRIVLMDGDKIVTKGDANNTIDDAITIDNVVGKVIYVGREFGVYLKVISTPLVYISFIMMVVFLNLAFEKESEEKKIEKQV